MTAGFAVWVTGPDDGAVADVARAIAACLRARQVPTETLDAGTPGIEALWGDGLVGRVAFVASTLARHGVATVIAVPGDRRAERHHVRTLIERMIEVYVRPASGNIRPGYEPPARPEVEIVAPETSAGTGVERTLRTLEILKLLPADAGTAYSEEEEREEGHDHGRRRVQPDQQRPGQRPAHAGVFLPAALTEDANPPTRTPDSKWFDTLNQRLPVIWRGEKQAAVLLKEIQPEVQKSLDQAKGAAANAAPEPSPDPTKVYDIPIEKSPIRGRRMPRSPSSSSPTSSVRTAPKRSRCSSRSCRRIRRT